MPDLSRNLAVKMMRRALAVLAVLVLIAGCTGPSSRGASTPTATGVPLQLLPDGSACSSSSECAGGNCRYGVCCPLGERCCTTGEHCPPSQECGTGSYCIPGSTISDPPIGPTDISVDPDALKVLEGDEVMVDYVGWTTDDRVVFDASIEEEARKSGLPPRDRYEPLAVKVGTGQVIQGFDRGLVGMAKDETKKIIIPPEEGYGPKDPGLFRPIPVDSLRAQGFEPEEGGQLITAGGAFPILNISDGMAWVDMNHMLAGREIAFRVTIRTIDRA